MLMLNINNALTSGRSLTLQNSAELFIVQNITQTIGAFTGSANTKLSIRAGATLNVDQSTNTTMAGTIFGFGTGDNKGKLRKWVKFSETDDNFVKYTGITFCKNKKELIELSLIHI